MIKYSWYPQEDHIILVIETSKTTIRFSIKPDTNMMQYIYKRMKEEIEDQQS